MSLSLKKEQMEVFLRQSAGEGAQFSCMLWGVIIASPAEYFEMGSTATLIASGLLVPGVAGSLSQAFCYIGCTSDCIYMVAVDTYRTENAVARFTIPFAQINAVKAKKSLLSGTYTVEIDSVMIDPGEGEGPEELPAWFMLQVKDTSMGTNIKDQKENKERFLGILEQIKAKQAV